MPVRVARKPAAPWRSLFARPVRSHRDALAFVETLGFCTWGPLPRLAFPNLAEAMGETAWSVMGRTWFWKDDVHLQRRLYYGKIIAGQPSFVAPDYLPDFIAALGGRGQEIERNPEVLYEEGRVSRGALRIYEALESQPRQASGTLRRTLETRSGSIERALVELQRRFLICKAELTGRTRGTYSYVWDLAERFWPEPFEEARGTGTAVARRRLRHRLRDFGLVPDEALESRLFWWRPV